MRTHRVLAAFLLAPLTPTVMMFLFVAYQAQTVGRAAPFDDLPRFLMINAAVAYPVAAVAGLPVYMATRGTVFAHWTLYMATGAAIGFIVAALFGPGTDSLVVTPMRQAAMVFGAASVLAFWLIARPDLYRSDV